MRLLPPILCAALAFAPTARLQAATVDRTPRAAVPQQLSRVLRNFDFEEQARGNVEEVPAGWVKVEGPGLPHYLHGEFDSRIAAAGKTSFRFDLNGGSITYRFPG